MSLIKDESIPNSFVDYMVLELFFFIMRSYDTDFGEDTVRSGFSLLNVMGTGALFILLFLFKMTLL